MRFEHLTVTEQRDWALERLQEAKAEIACLKNDLATKNDASFLGLLKAQFGLTPHQAKVMCVLWQARGKALTHAFINDQLPVWGTRKDREDILTDIINVYVHHIRKATDRSAIILVKGIGYSMSAEWVEKLDALHTQVEAA